MQPLAMSVRLNFIFAILYGFLNSPAKARLKIRHVCEISAWCWNWTTETTMTAIFAGKPSAVAIIIVVKCDIDIPLISKLLGMTAPSVSIQSLKK